MINRTLIRLKTVQMLYSYLLTRHEFTIEPEPKKLTKDTRSAYALYLDLLLVILKLSGKQIGNCDNVFACSSRLEQFKLVNLISHNEKIGKIDEETGPEQDTIAKGNDFIPDAQPSKQRTDDDKERYLIANSILLHHQRSDHCCDAKDQQDI